MKDRKFKSRFEGIARFSKSAAGHSTSLASIYEAGDDLSGLRSLLPSREEIEKNPDFLYFSCNLATINLVNLNHDACTSEMAVAMADNCRYKQINVEHDRDHITGVITGAGYTRFGSNLPMTEEEALATTEPFNLAISGIIWRITGEIANILEESDNPTSHFYHQVSVSWEVAFDEYNIAVGSKTLSIASLKSGADAEPYAKFLRANGGTGMSDAGYECYRVLIDPLLLGAGITTTPAAAVRGVVVPENEPEPVVYEAMSSQKAVAEVLAAPSLAAYAEAVFDENPRTEIVSEADIKEKIKIVENKISTAKELPVTNIRIKSPMKFTDLQSAIAHLEAVAPEALNVQEMSAFLQAEFAKASELYVNEQNSKAEAEQKLQTAILDSSEARAKVAELEGKFSALEAQAAAKAQQDIFDARFSALAADYSIEDAKVSALVAKQINGLDDTAFASWKENDGQVILAGREKEKAPVKSEAALEGLKEATASVDIPNAAKTTDAPVPSIFDLAKEVQVTVK